MPTPEKTTFFSSFRHGFIQGIGFSLGSTLGFTVISAFIVFLVQQAGGLPVVGTFFASIVESTQAALAK